MWGLHHLVRKGNGQREVSAPICGWDREWFTNASSLLRKSDPKLQTGKPSTFWEQVLHVSLEVKK